MNKKQKTLCDNYNHAKYTSINELYKKPSFYKTRAEHLILKQMLDENGTDYRVIGGNSQVFSCAYRYFDQNNWHLRYFTAYNTYDFII